MALREPRSVARVNVNDFASVISKGRNPGAVHPGPGSLQSYLTDPTRPIQYTNSLRVFIHVDALISVVSYHSNRHSKDLGTRSK